MTRAFRFKVEFRDVLAVLALGVVVLAMLLEASGHPVAEWLRLPIGTAVSVLLGYYFVDNAKKGAAASTPPPAPESADAAAEH